MTFVTVGDHGLGVPDGRDFVAAGLSGRPNGRQIERLAQPAKEATRVGIAFPAREDDISTSRMGDVGVASLAQQCGLACACGGAHDRDGRVPSIREPIEKPLAEDLPGLLHHGDNLASPCSLTPRWRQRSKLHQVNDDLDLRLPLEGGDVVLATCVGEVLGSAVVRGMDLPFSGLVSPESHALAVVTRRRVHALRRHPGGRLGDVIWTSSRSETTALVVDREHVVLVSSAGRQLGFRSIDAAAFEPFVGALGDVVVSRG